MERNQNIECQEAAARIVEIRIKIENIKATRNAEIIGITSIAGEMLPKER
jgi:hypothetical protein